MKSLIILILLIAAPAMADPFLVADPQSAEWYAMRLSTDNGATWGAWTEGPPVEGALRFDLGGIPQGTYKGQARAGGNVTVTDEVTGEISTVWLWSDNAPFVLSVRSGSTPVKVKGRVSTSNGPHPNCPA